MWGLGDYNGRAEAEKLHSPIGKFHEYQPINREKYGIVKYGVMVALCLPFSLNNPEEASIIINAI